MRRYFFVFQLFLSSILMGMHNTGTVEMPHDMWVKVIACSDTKTKNALGKCSILLHKLHSKNNLDLYMQHPLFLNCMQLDYALFLSIYKNNEDVFENLLRYKAYRSFGSHYYLGINTSPDGFITYQNNHKFIALFDHYLSYESCDRYNSTWFTKKTSPYAMAAFLGDSAALRDYVQSEDYSPLYEKYNHLNNPTKPGALLYAAIARGHYNVIELLLTHPKTIEYINYGQKGARPIDIAFANGQTAIVECLLNIPSVRMNGRDYRTATLYNCAKKGYTECIKILLERGGISINKLLVYHSFENVWCDTGMNALCSILVYPSALTIAAYNGNKDVVELLLKHKKIDVNICAKNYYHAEGEGRYGFTPLYAASLQGHTDVVELLLAHPDIDPCLYMEHYTPLHIACKKGHIDIVKLLVKHSPQLLSMRTKDTLESPYQVAYHNKQCEVIEFLLMRNK